MGEQVRHHAGCRECRCPEAEPATTDEPGLRAARAQDAATIRGNVGTLVGWATSNRGMRPDLARNAVTLIEAGLSGLLTPAASDGSLDVATLRSMREGVQQGVEAMVIVYPVITALRTWRDARNTTKNWHAIADAENDVLTQLRYFEERADALRDEHAARLSESPSEGKTE